MVIHYNSHTPDRISLKASNTTPRERVQSGNTVGKLIEASTLKEENISFSEEQTTTLDFSAHIEITMEESDALWDKMFAASQNYLDKLADEIESKYLAGLTEDFDPDDDPDLK
jgi:hypothetical protein